MRYFSSLLNVSLISLFIAGCNTSTQDESHVDASIEKNTGVSQQLYWVNSAKQPCTGVAPMQCLQVQKNAEIDDKAWEHFYTPIQGFDYQAGFVYQIKVQEEVLADQEVPADSSSIRYSLIEVLSKKADNTLLLNDIWALESVAMQAFTLSEHQERPQLEIHVSYMTARGTDGCNQFNGQINTLTNTTLNFGPAASTRRMCMDMTITDQFNQAMAKVQGYKLEALSLVLLDDAGNELLRFKKID